jgi:predicted nucleotidyltransferase
MKTISEEIIRQMTDRIVERFKPKRVILFGSAARGELTPDSDLDFLVIMPFEGRRRDLCVRIRTALSGFGVSKDVMVLTPEEYERRKDIPGTIAYPAAREGRVLYAA